MARATVHLRAFARHPDRGGDGETIKRINVEYEQAFKDLKDTHKTQTGERYEAKQKTTEVPEDFIRIIEKLIHIQDIVVEVCGSWIWITGNTKPNAETFKDLHFHWSNSKQAWYWYAPGTESHSRHHYTMEQIRQMHGSTQYNGKQQNAVATAD